MNRAERRRRTALVVKKRRLYADGHLGYLIHPDKSCSVYTKNEYQREVEKFHNQKQTLLGRSRKIHPWDCGRSRCHVCSLCKLLGEKTLREKQIDLDHREQVEDLNGFVDRD